MSTKMVQQPNMQQRAKKRFMWLAILLCGTAGLSWLLLATRWERAAAPPVAAVQSALVSGGVATMDSPFLRYSGGWTVGPQGADPHEPADPWNQPSGVVEFPFTGNELMLEVAVGDYWGYLYATVDGDPANLLPAIPGNLNSQSDLAGYKTFYEPEKAVDGQPGTRWLPIHRVPNLPPDTLHQARVEVWRSWGQTPLRAVAVDALPARALPLWPGALLLLLALAVAPLSHLSYLTQRAEGRSAPGAFNSRGPLNEAFPLTTGSIWVGSAAVLIIGLAVWLDRWWLCLAGLVLLGGVSVLRPSLWLAALLFALPFYFGVPLPLLPGRDLGIIDVGILGGMAAVVGNWGVKRWRSREVEGGSNLVFHTSPLPYSSTPLLALWLIVAWALAAATRAEYQALALREWRTIFLAAGIFGLLLHVVLHRSRRPGRDRALLLYAWLAGATLVALVALWQYASGSMLITAEGVYRVRGLYGSPNNLALYLERTLAVVLALALFGAGHQRWIWSALAAVQLVALLLTFSKGGILLGLPAMLVTLAWIGVMWRREQFPARRVLTIVAVVAVLAVLVVAPFLGTERFQRLLDFSQGTGFIRLQLWRSAWQMALDHPLFGVGPDNFLYAYRSTYLLPAAWQEPNLNHPHNLLLDWWTRLGVPGVMLGLLFFGGGVVKLWRALKEQREVAFYPGLLAAAAAALAHGLIDVSYALPDLMIVWAFLFLLPDREESER